MKKQKSKSTWYIKTSYCTLFLGAGRLKIMLCRKDYPFSKFSWSAYHSKAKEFVSVNVPYIGISFSYDGLQAFVDRLFYVALFYSVAKFLKDVVVKPIKFFWWHIQAIRNAEDSFERNEYGGFSFNLWHDRKRCTISYATKKERQYAVAMYASDERDKAYYNSWFSLYYVSNLHQTGFRIEGFKVTLSGFSCKSIMNSAKGFVVLRDLANSEVSNHLCLSDPMNGCPGDFSESFSREEYRKGNFVDSLNLPPTFNTKAYQLCSNRAWYKYSLAPAPWDLENEF
jgi:hypothetical protein